jgi:NTE family protein
MGMTPDQALRTATKMWSQELTRQHRWRGWLQLLAPKLSTAMINDLTKARNAAARVAGQRVLHIELALERRVGLRETAALPYLYEAGRRAARAQLPQIMALLEGRPSRAAA